MIVQVIGSSAATGAVAPKGGSRRWTVEQPPHDAGQQGDQAYCQGNSGPRRTWLAAERTYLAWLRAGLGAVGVALAVGRLIPALIGGSSVAYATLGTGYGVLGAFMVAYAMWRLRRVTTALEANGPVVPDWWAVSLVTAVSLALAVGTIAIVLVAA